MFALDEYKELTNNSIAKLDAKFLSFYGLTALIFLAVFVGQYFYGSFAEIIYYYLAVSMFFSAFFISKLITVIFEFFYKNNHASLLFLTSLPRLSLFLLAFVFFKNTVHEEMNKNLVLIAICLFFSLTLFEAILKLKLFSRI
ncbi:MAG: hypothetical protein RLZ61_2280 [Planctomycetota bacterium]